MSRRFFRSCGLLLLLVGGLGESASAEPIIISGNFGPDPGYQSQGWKPVVDDVWYRMGFQVTEDAQLTSLTFPLVWGPRLGYGYRVWLLPAENASVDNALDFFHYDAPPDAQPGQVSLITVPSSQRPILIANTTYFLGVIAHQAIWPWNNAGITGPVIQEDTGGTRMFQGPLSAFQLHGDPSAVPEPGTLILLASGAAVLARRARQRCVR